MGITLPIRQTSVGRRPRPVPVRVLAAFFWQLGVLIDAGVPLLGALHALSASEPHVEFRRVVDDLARGISHGKRLSVAMADHPAVFDDLTRAMVALGERVGLSAPVRRIARLLEQREETRERVVTALRYPALVVISAIVMTFGLFRWVLPGLLEIPPQSAAQPLLSRLVGGLVWAAGNTWVVMGASVLLFLIARAIWQQLQTPSAAATVERMIMKVPFIGRIVSTGAQVQLCRALEIQLACGVNVMSALGLAESACPSHGWKAHCRDVRSAIAQGATLTDAFADGCPPHGDLLIGMVALGDQSGDYAFPLGRAANLLEEDFRQRLGTLMDILTPVLLALSGGVALVALLAALTPLQQMLGDL